MTIQHILPAVLAAVFALFVVPAQAEMKNQWVDYSHGDTKLKAYMAYDDKVTGRRPAVLVAHARSGMSPQTLKLTEICRSRPTFSATARACCRRTLRK